MGHLGRIDISKLEKEIKKPKKIIEDWFPIEVVGEEGRQEKTSQGARLSSLHQWYARRPVCAARAIVIESICDIPQDIQDYEKIKDFIIQYSHRSIPTKIVLSNPSKKMKEEIRTEDILKRFLSSTTGGNIYRACDPFSGGGTIPFELAYAGCEAYASDLNPVAVLINKALVEYFIRYGRKMVSDIYPKIRLAAQEIQNEISEKIGSLYSNPIHKNNQIKWYLWVNEIQCQNNDCGLIIPLFKTLLLNSQNKEAIIPNIPSNTIEKEIQYQIGWREDPKFLKGFYQKGKVTCPRCGLTHDNLTIHTLFRLNKNHERLIAIAELMDEGEMKIRLATVLDYTNFQQSKDFLTSLQPNLELPKRVWKWVIHNFGILYTKQMFNDRQYLIASFIVDLIIKKYPILKSKYGEDIAKVIVVYLQYGLDKLVDYNSRFCTAKSGPNEKGTRVGHTWGRPGLFMTGMYIEVNPLAAEKISGSWMSYFHFLKNAFDTITSHPIYNPFNLIPIIGQMDAQSLSYQENYFDAVITDPPYYDNIPYAADSDFFYVWEKATLNEIYPELFINPSTPKDEELVADPDLRGNRKKAKDFYEAGMSRAFSEIYRVLKPNGLAVIIFAHKHAAAWETLLQAFVQSKFVITATWPVPMESRGKLAALTTASLTSVVLVVARKKQRKSSQYFDKNFQNHLTNKIHNRMQEFWDKHIRGADFFMCGIGPSMKYYSKYDAVLDPKTDKPISVSEYLAFIQNILVNFAVEQISQTAYSGVLDHITQFYLVWRWGYGLNLLPFDEMKILYQALTIEPSELEKSIIQKKKAKADYECLGPNERFKNIDIKKLAQFAPDSMIDYLHFTCYLWEKDERILLEKMINSALLKFGDALWTIAQALHDVLPECHEQTQLQNLLQRYKKFKPRQDFVPKSEKVKQMQKTLFPNTETEKKMIPDGEEETSNGEEFESEDDYDEEK